MITFFLFGYTYDQLQGEICKEMAALFFVPLVLGSSISIAYTILANIRTDLQLVIVTFGAALLFFVIKYVLYRVTIWELVSQYLT